MARSYPLIVYRTNIARAEAQGALAWLYPYQLDEIRDTLLHVPSSDRTALARQELSRKHPDEFKRLYRQARAVLAPYKRGPVEKYDKLWEKAKVLIQDGKSYREITEILGVSKPWLVKRNKAEKEKRENAEARKDEQLDPSGARNPTVGR